MQEEAAEAHLLGESCSFDCYACEVRARTHDHPCVVCAAPVRCSEEHWDVDDEPIPGLVRCDAHALPPLVWHGPERTPGDWGAWF